MSNALHYGCFVDNAESDDCYLDGYGTEFEGYTNGNCNCADKLYKDGFRDRTDCEHWKRKVISSDTNLQVIQVSSEQARKIHAVINLDEATTGWIFQAHRTQDIIVPASAAIKRLTHIATILGQPGDLCLADEGYIMFSVEVPDVCED